MPRVARAPKPFAAPSRGGVGETATAASGVGAPAPAFAMSNGLVSDAWSTISGAPSDLTFPEDFLGTWLCYSTLTRVDTPQGEELVQDLAVVNRARRDVGSQIVYPMRFVRNDQGRVVMDRAYNVVKMAEATAKQYNVIEAVEWDVNDPNVLRGSIGGDGRSVFFRVNQRSEEYPAPDRIETSEVAQIVFDGGDNGGTRRRRRRRRTGFRTPSPRERRRGRARRGSRRSNPAGRSRSGSSGPWRRRRTGRRSSRGRRCTTTSRPSTRGSSKAEDSP